MLWKGPKVLTLFSCIWCKSEKWYVRIHVVFYLSCSMFTINQKKFNDGFSTLKNMSIVDVGQWRSSTMCRVIWLVILAILVYALGMIKQITQKSYDHVSWICNSEFWLSIGMRHIVPVELFCYMSVIATLLLKQD